MNRLFGGGKNKGPSNTNLQIQKTKQVESLRKVGAKEINRDVEYRVSFRQGTVNLTIIINLPTQFPSEKPVLTVQPAVSHPWLDPQMKVIGCPKINDFSMHSDLGQAVQSVLDEFKTNPPLVIPQHYILGYNNPTIGGMTTAPPISSLSNNSTYANMTPLPAMEKNQSSTPPPLPPRRNVAGDSGGSDQHLLSSFSLKNILTEFPALKDMKLYELQELEEDENKITEMVQKVPDLHKFAQQRESLSRTCVLLAQSNLSKKPEIENLKEAVHEKRREYDQLKADFEQDSEHHMVLSEQYHPTNIQTNLKVAVMEADEESENIAESFLNQELDTDEFMKKFLEKRTLCHLRRAKEEKLNQIILSHGSHY